MSVNTYIMIAPEDGYFEIFPFAIGEFKKTLYSGEMFLRYEWPEVVIKNEPKNYETTLLDCYRLYNLIKAKKYNEEIKIKHIWTDGTDTITVEGVFWSYMCYHEDDDEHKTIKITPIILDEYTYFLENWETEIDVITGGGKNKMLNGNFTTWGTDGRPVVWDSGVSPIFIYRKFDMILAKILGFDDDMAYLKQSFNINADQLIQFSFDYEIIFLHTEYIALMGHRKVTVSLVTNSATYYLNKVGDVYEWNTDSSGIYYITNKPILDIEHFEKLKHFEIISEVVPAAGTLTISFDTTNCGVVPSVLVYLVLGNVKLYANTTQYENITINIPPQYLETKSIYDSDHILKCRPTTADYNDATPLWADDPLFGFFNQDASFNMTMGADVGLGLSDPALEDAKLCDIITAYQTLDPNDILLEHYLFELSDITVYDTLEPSWIDFTDLTTQGRKYTRIIATASFSRQVAYTQDAEGSVPVEPAGTGWYDTSIVDIVKGRKWLRLPYGGTSSWEFYGGTVTATGINVKIGKLNGYRMPYFKSLSSRRTYTASATKTYAKGIDLRDLFRMFFHNLHPIYGDKEVYSTFFWNDFEENMSTIFTGRNPGINYVTLDRNFLNNITCLHTRELKTIIENDSADNELKVSFKNFLADIKSYFNIYNLGGLYWWIDVNYNFHIEHAKYLDVKGVCVNISEYVGKPMKNWKLNADVLYSFISFDQVNSGYKDFHLNTMKFETLTITINPEKKKENKTNILSTDVRYCYENPANLINGLVLINHDGNHIIQYAETRISGINEVNGNLSLSTILNLFCRYEGVWTEGFINDKKVVFEKCLRMIEGDEVITKGIIDGYFFDTPIDYGGLGRSITHNFNDQTTKATIIYCPIFRIMVNKSSDYVGAENVPLDIGFHY
jgi:hypothetical protein